MTTVFDEFRDLAIELAEDFMVPAKLVRVTDGYDPRTDRTSSSEQITACRAVIAPRKTKNDDGILTVQTMAVMTTKPEIGDRLKLGCTEYNITLVEEVAPAGTPIIWMAVVTS